MQPVLFDTPHCFAKPGGSRSDKDCADIPAIKTFKTCVTEMVFQTDMSDLTNPAPSEQAPFESAQNSANFLGPISLIACFSAAVKTFGQLISRRAPA